MNSLPPLISILFPTFNSISRFGSDIGERFLAESLSSLVAQTHSSFEIIINDNQSSDGTIDFLQATYGLDSRFHLTTDSQKRVPEDGIAEAFKWARGNFVIIANDDDFYHPRYLETLYRDLASNTNLDLAYSSGNYVNDQGVLGAPLTYPHLAEPYTRLSSNLSRAICYFEQRDILPANFGLFRRVAFESLLPYRPFDVISANCDHRFMYNFHLSGMLCSFRDESLLFYRDRGRNLTKGTSFVDSFSNQDSIIDFYIQHEIKFLEACISDAMRTCFSLQDPSLFIAAHLPLSLSRMKDLLHWLMDIPDLQGPSWNARCTRILDEVVSLIGMWRDFSSRGVYEHLESSIYSVRSSSDLNSKVIQMIDSLMLLGFEFNLPVLPLKRSAIGRKAYDSKSSSPDRNFIAPYTPGTNELVVLVNSFNLAPFLESTFSTIRNQSSTAFDVFVMDGGSTDGSLTWIRDQEDVVLVSSSDRNYVDGLNLGLAASDHKYVTQCAVSDGYCDPDWYAKAINLLESDITIDLVFGFPVVLNQDETFGDIGWSDMFYADLTDSKSLTMHWITKGFVLPEGNFIARREVFKKCFPRYRKDIYKRCEPFLDFTSIFFATHHRAVGIPTVANFGRTHANQLGESMRKSRLNHIHDFRFLKQRVHYFVKHYLMGLPRCNRPHLKLILQIIAQFDWKSSITICLRRFLSLLRIPS